MFEKTLHSQSAFAPGIHALGTGESHVGDSLRRFGWDELSARILAARDLRRELRQQEDHRVPAQIQSSASLAGFSQFHHEDEHSVNRDVLEERKAYAAIHTHNEGGLSKGEEENTDD